MVILNSHYNFCRWIATVLLLLKQKFSIVRSFQPICSSQGALMIKHARSRSNAFTLLLSKQQPDSDDTDKNLDYLKNELQGYLKLREEVKADDLSKAQAGKIVGGSKGNVFLEYISAVPTAPMELEESHPFDYSELTKYGYSHCVKLIMELPGGRRDAYRLMNMVPPRISSNLKPKKPRDVKIDFDGTGDKNGFQGMRKMLSEDDIAQQLEWTRKQKSTAPENQDIKSTTSNYEIPFASRKKSATRRQPEWTPEMLDEEGRRRGQTYDWARRVREEKETSIRKTDSAETIDVNGGSRVYATVFSLLSSIAYGKATPQALEWIDVATATTITTSLHGIALMFVLTSIASSAYSSTVLAPQKNRNSFIWAVKGFVGGPLAVVHLKELDNLA